VTAFLIYKDYRRCREWSSRTVLDE